MSNQSINQNSSKREVISIPIDNGFISLRGLSPQRLRFAIEYSLERGSTANSFVFNSGADNNGNHQSSVLIHPPGIAFADVFIPELKKFIPSLSKELWIVVGHVNPNRIALIKKLAKIYSNIQIISSNPGAKLIQEIWNQQKPTKEIDEINTKNIEIPLPNIQIIRKEETLIISNHYKLHLIPAPTARWPGGLIAYEETQGLLMSDKFFGAHLCTQEWAEANRTSTEEERRHYYDCLMAPMANQVDGLVERFEELDIYTIAPGHGPAIEGSWRSLLNDYRRWGEGQKKAPLKIVLLFASAYGNTAAIADALANGINRTGIRVNSLNCEFTSINDLSKAIQSADAYLIGSPTLGGHAPTPIVSALGTLLAEGDRKKPVGIFGSYGWSGEALSLLENKLKDGGFTFGFKPIKIKFSPNASMVKTLEETGTIFGRKLLKSQKLKERRATGGISASRSDPTMLALGRIVGCLCILTTQKGEGDKNLSGAMVASWVSQASFSPPGISIAVAKDRAVESLLYKEDRFILNVLGAGKETQLMKQFLQPFAPGEDRFAGVHIETSPNQQPILPNSLAWLEGCVKQRMECNDHWIIYAEIEHGKVIDQHGVTAIHHRKSGANY